MSFLLNSCRLSGSGSNDILPFLNKSIDAARDGSSSKKQDLTTICQWIINVNSKVKAREQKATRYERSSLSWSCFRSEVIGRVIEVLVWLQEPSIIRKAVDAIVGEVPLAAFKALASVVRSDQFAASRGVYVPISNGCSEVIH